MRLLVVLVVLAAPSAALAAASPPSHDPYTASLAYVKCMRAHGVPQPNPDRSGNLHLTLQQEARLKRVPFAKRQAADKACFHTLKGLDNRPLTRQAQLRALGVLRQLSRCLARRGYKTGPPVVRNLSRGRAMFGFARAPGGGTGGAAALRAEHACEKRVRLAQKLDAIIAQDRSGA
jgi:hypothetical protein